MSAWFRSVEFQPEMSWQDSFVAMAEGYLSLGKEKLRVCRIYPEDQKNLTAIVDSKSSNWLVTTAKVVSYFTVILPLIALAIKISFRLSHTIRVLNHSPTLLQMIAPKESEVLRRDPSESSKNTHESYIKQKSRVTEDFPLAFFPITKQKRQELAIKTARFGEITEKNRVKFLDTTLQFIQDLLALKQLHRTDLKPLSLSDIASLRTLSIDLRDSPFARDFKETLIECCHSTSAFAGRDATKIFISLLDELKMPDNQIIYDYTLDQNFQHLTIFY